MNKKLKSFLSDDAFFMALLLILVGTISFGLGRQSAERGGDVNSGGQTAGIVFTELGVIAPLQQASTPSSDELNTIKVVASKSGTKYHLLDCSGAKSIKTENKIFFDSIAFAKAAGYTPAANCDGL